jgi:DnaJ-like protein
VSDSWSRRESLIDEQIRKAQERGEFDNLPGKGKPLTGLDEPDDELWWVRRYISREGLSTEALLPPALQLRKETERLDETVRGLASEEAVRNVVTDLNLRIAEWVRVPVGPSVPLRLANADETVARWRAARAAPPERPQLERAQLERAEFERAQPGSAGPGQRPGGPSAGGSGRPSVAPWWRRFGRRSAR